MTWNRSRTVRCAGFVLLSLGLSLPTSGPASGAVRDPFPDPRPATRAAAVALVAEGVASPNGCLTSQLQALGGRKAVGPDVRRALLMLQRQEYPDVDQNAFAADGTRIAYSVEPSAFDRLSPIDRDQDGRPDLLLQVTTGLDQARGLLVDWLGLPAPLGLEVVLLELGTDHTGYLVAPDWQPGRIVLVLDSSAPSDGDTARHAAIHQYAHAIALAAGPRMPREWGEALATWATLFLDGQPDSVTAELLSTRLEHLDEGLGSRAPELSAGNAIWFAFLEEYYGPAAVSAAVQELAQGGPVAAALDRAVARTSDDDLATAFREFHLWSILVGSRADRFHFSFAGRLAEPGFASDNSGLPALSVQADPSLAPWGATQVRIVPDSDDGGLDLRFEGDLTATWQADLLLLDDEGTMRRLAIDVAREGWGQSILPLDDVAEALLLVRNIGSDDAAPRRYSYAAHRERGFPFELSGLEARSVGEAGAGIDITWETASESRLVGFNLLRVREGGGTEIVANPVWIPALGDRTRATSYHFLDRDIVPGASYIYRVQGITLDGLTSTSDPVVARRTDVN